MKQTYLHDQRGVAMLLELVLVAAVIALVGVAVYQSGKHQNAANTQQQTQQNGQVKLANTAAAISETESAADASLSEGAEASAVTATESDVDITNLGGSTGAEAF